MWRTAGFFSVFFLHLYCASNAELSNEINEHPLFIKMKMNSNLSEIYSILMRSISERSVLIDPAYSTTLFAPTNMAFQVTGNKITLVKDNIFLGYHITTEGYLAEELPSELTPMKSSIGRLFVTRTAKGDIYVNNAKILSQHTEVYSTSNPHSKKIVHVIDAVLVPLRLKQNEISANSIFKPKDNPNAFGLLEHHNYYELANHQLGVFHGLVKQYNRTEMFRSPKFNTYFIPVDTGLNAAKGIIDHKIIDAHVVYDRVLFVQPTPKNEVYETAAFSDMAKATVSFQHEIQDSALKRRQYVSSNTKPGSGHTSGRVLSEIVYPNIPVQNGVVHLISKPLMLVDRNIKQLVLEDGPGSLDPIISTFKEKVNRLRLSIQNFMSKLDGQQQITLLIPSNSAWKDPVVERALTNNNTSFLQSILDLHLIQEPLTMENIRNRNSNEVASLSKNKFLYFNLITQGTNRTLTVEGGGVNATVLFPDIGATNGVIHVIDRVLGIPSATVGKKVATNPDLNFTYQLGNIPYTIGKHRNFNERLDDPSKNYTFLVPRDAAWATLKTQYPNIYQALSQPGVAYDILNKHLIEGRNFSMADLKNTSNQMYQLQTSNGGLNIKVSTDPKDQKSGYTIMWNDIEVGVYRPDIPCTNGFVHIIDRVLIRPEDLKNIPVGDASKHSNVFSLFMILVLPLGMMVLYQ